MDYYLDNTASVLKIMTHSIKLFRPQFIFTPIINYFKMTIKKKADTVMLVDSN